MSPASAHACSADQLNLLPRSGFVQHANLTPQVRDRLAAAFKRDPVTIACKGCREQGNCSVLDEPCATRACVGERRVAYCFECADFPCRRLMPLAAGADRRPHNVKVYNLCRMKAVGVAAWAEREADDVRKRYYTGAFRIGTGPLLPGAKG
ncbi:MAG: DUF3795 domain-containing protein [Deltaproteobacteria bacterium]|nr:DUF3795 domain-containing protein [Deltaproteobacteria bacterium]